MWFSIPLSAGLCLGLPSVTWALFSLKGLKDGGGRISPFIFFLIYSDIMELLLCPFVNTRLLEGTPCHTILTCCSLCVLLAVARLCGLHFHQLVALQGILSLVYPAHTVHFLWSSILGVIVWIFVVTCQFFEVGYICNLIACFVPVTLVLITSILTVKASLAFARSPDRRKFPGFNILAFALSTLVLYMPCIILSCVNYPDPFYQSSWVPAVVSIMSLRLVTEPLLCVLVCRETKLCWTPHPPTDLLHA